MEQLFGGKITKDNTKRIRIAYERYQNQYHKNLWDVYDRPSYNKEKAWKYCEDLMKEADGRGLSVIGYNTMIFSAGFMAEVDGRDVFVYITPHRNSYMEI